MSNNVRLISLLDQLGYDLSRGDDAATVAALFGFNIRTVRRWNTDSKSGTTAPLCAVKLAELLVARLPAIFVSVTARENLMNVEFHDTLAEAIEGVRKFENTTSFSIFQHVPGTKQYRLCAAG